MQHATIVQNGTYYCIMMTLSTFVKFIHWLLSYNLKLQMMNENK